MESIRVTDAEHISREEIFLVRVLFLPCICAKTPITRSSSVKLARVRLPCTLSSQKWCDSCTPRSRSYSSITHASKATQASLRRTKLPSQSCHWTASLRQAVPLHWNPPLVLSTMRAGSRLLYSSSKLYSLTLQSTHA
jgi:hypothetical protein